MRLKAFHKVLGPVPDDEEQINEFAVYIIVYLNWTRRFIKQEIGCTSEDLNINVVAGNQRQKRLEQIVLSTDVGEEAEPSQHNVGMIKLASLI